MPARAHSSAAGGGFRARRSTRRSTLSLLFPSPLADLAQSPSPPPIAQLAGPPPPRLTSDASQPSPSGGAQASEAYLRGDGVGGRATRST
ncbi:hypothetical protein U9M48_030640 [Paspalum notatum var. saurae]|uniref:Uncharacterized protein n=1 Tax=Paspalum notatum var. saurae TaxID=547442 RepID=A0AAQ3U1C2_PASNO